ncbi:MAG: retropepsin-like aspartic protease [Pseudomonadota bacterium]|nr:retropepsin-like aspartic protease [Pseudomonadota bacterium]
MDHALTRPGSKRALLRWIAAGTLALSVAHANPATIEVLALFNGAALLRVGTEQMLLRAGETGPNGIRLLAANSQTATMQIGEERHQVGLSQRVSARFQPRTTTKEVIPLSTEGQYRTVGTINGQTVEMLVDTGASTVAMSAPTARRLGIDFRLQGDPIWVTTASQRVRAWRLTLDRVSVGSVVVLGVDAAVLEGDLPPMTLLGMSFMRHVQFTEQDGVLEISNRW